MVKKKFSNFSLTVLLSFLGERFFKIRSLQVLVSGVMLSLFGMILLLGWLYSQEVKDIVTRDFKYSG
ncbi:MAG: hypothetical protein C4538_00125 [Nitrospiraceae bacterium]|nr:MAG: hypothetical protein C4538_00125 [Nitrospiraceae bacterium]